MSVPIWDISPPLSTSKLGQNSILQQEVLPDRWKRWEYVLLINETRQEGKGEGGGGDTGRRGRGDHVERCQNHKHIHSFK